MAPKQPYFKKVKNDLSLDTGKQHVTLLILLDLSAAFDDIVYHDMLIDRFKCDLGTEDNALAWLKSYLSNWSQRVSIDNRISRNLPITEYGVQQGSWPCR